MDAYTTRIRTSPTVTIGATTESTASIHIVKGRKDWSRKVSLEMYTTIREYAVAKILWKNRRRRRHPGVENSAHKGLAALHMEFEWTADSYNDKLKYFLKKKSRLKKKPKKKHNKK